MAANRSFSLVIAGLTALAGGLTAYAEPGAAQPTPAQSEPSTEPLVNDPAAKQLVDEAVAAVRALKSLSCTVKRDTEGLGGLRLAGESTIQFIRNEVLNEYSFSAKGTAELAAEEATPHWLSVIRSKRILWVDESTKQFFDEPFGQKAAGFRWISRLRDVVVPPFLLEKEPLERAAKGRRYISEPAQEVHGEICQVVRVINEEKKMEQVLAIGGDKLPRMIEMIKIDGKLRLVRRWTMWDVKANSVTEKDLEITAPEGYEVKKVDGPAEGVKAPATKPAGAAAPAPSAPRGNAGIVPGGLRPGADVPAFEAKLADGADFKSDAFKGHVTVLGFWQPIVTASAQLGQSLQSVASANASQPVKVYGVACRDGSDAASVGKVFADKKWSFGSVIEGDTLASRFNVRGFPSIAVVGADGRVVAFYESVPSASELQSTIDSAVKLAIAK